ncbi:site-specific integrase [Neorhizobium galegae]|uniref:site-specific integrase n=1 Tax=Neorhizobium galegae TaxID=399 RepID=UPI000621BE22|nr:site-specific integrase [Neorhizobium galegae]CDZ50945.1 DNA breaking-rejoining enzyme [Neorhizobium galegae bv. orientalis]
MRPIDGAASSGDLPPLPDSVTTRDGIVFDPRRDQWPLGGLSRKHILKFDEFDRLSIGVVQRLKWLLIVQFKEKSFAHGDNLFSNFLWFYRSALSMLNSSCERIELSHILSYKTLLNDSTEWKLGVLRIVLTDMSRLGFGIASDEVLEYLDSATIRGNIKGTSIRTRDSRKGAFSDAELLTIQSALNDAYASGEIDLNNFALAWLFLAYGCRPIQIAAMKEKDLLVSENSEGKAYALRIPRAKQKGSGHRDVFNARYCSKQIGALLERVIANNALQREMLQLKQGEAPLFIGRKKGELSELAHHRTSQSIGHTINNTIERISGLKGNSKRFRITLGQRAVDDGKDKWTVAELLDHSDTQNVEVYFEASPAMVLRLDRHLAMELAPIAQAFSGVVVETEEEARRGGDRTSRIYDRTLVDNITDPLGTCGQMSFCGLAAPYACYTCRHFQPWIDGPHEEFMAAMIADRKRLEDDGISPKIFTIRDRAILAAAEVIQLCSAEREARQAVT